ncbi:mucin-5AC-like [Parambassis ranga]|uniref:Mucin-5AC-like n=1 Tax=Parambassis ranga TaxID=210632 RepID=A0A6P7HYK3_9TELE|nr:mucin-5AC-like [Parambassis ranga]XP_028253600.1 mucin-5AC-like [Parambassis ranga]
MIKWLSVAIVAGLVLESSQLALNVSTSTLVERSDETDFASSLSLGIMPELPCYYPTHIRCWTDWFDRDNPTGTGDWETLYNLRIENPEKICPKPVQIEAQTLSGISAAAAGEVIYRSDTTSGFICRIKDQPDKKCNDYRVRFSCHPPFCGAGVCWTQWYDRDDPSGTGDWELLSNLRLENPGAICDSPLYIEVVTTDTLTPAISTGDSFYIFNPTQGFVCRKTDQPSGTCRDYKVRFGCPCSYKPLPVKEILAQLSD